MCLIADIQMFRQNTDKEDHISNASQISCATEMQYELIHCTDTSRWLMGEDSNIKDGSELLSTTSRRKTNHNFVQMMHIVKPAHDTDLMTAVQDMMVPYTANRV